ncbi:MAG: site-specific integrase, partial [Proteobacteria bacterium]|nr:site-specific integrase [Pseudomonadota bacterium]
VDGLSWGLIDANPCAGIKRIRAQDQEHCFWEFMERDRFLDFARTRNPALHDIVAFTVNTGLRRGEVEGLLRDCIDYERKEIVVRRSHCHKTGRLNEYTKGKSIRRVQMNEIVWELMKAHRLKGPQQNIFGGDFQHIVVRYFKPLQNEAGVKVITFHDLRHSFASHLAMRAVSLFDIQKLLGHSDVKTTQRYMHLAPDHLQGVTDVLLRPQRNGASGRESMQREVSTQR